MKWETVFLILLTSILVSVVLFFPMIPHARPYHRCISFKGGKDVQMGNMSTIFVSIASYRDYECKKTVHSLFEQATFPTRVYVGICEQNKDANECCVVEPVVRGRIEQISIPYDEAKGPCYARYLCATMYKQQDLFLQIDSHTRFVKGWDEKVVKMVNDMPVQDYKGILTHYPLDCTKDCDMSHVGTAHVPVISFAELNKEPTFRCDHLEPPGSYVTSRSVGGGFLLMHRNAINACPYDPDLLGVFNKEEILQAARFYTHGFDLFAPTENIVCHRYTYEEHKVPWNEANPTWNKKNGQASTGNQRCDDLLLGLLEGDPYGMGTERTLAEFWNYIGIDYKAKTVREFHVQQYSSPTKHIDTGSHSPEKTETHTQTPLSVVVLVICAHGTPRWDLEYAQYLRRLGVQEAAGISQAVHFRFLRCKHAEGAAIPNHYDIDECIESFTPGILEKTIAGLKLALLHEQPRFDYFVRTNLSTFIHRKRLVDLLQRVHSRYETSEPLYTGCLDFDWGVSGACMIMNRAAAKILVNHFVQWNEIADKTPDDVVIGQVLKPHRKHLAGSDAMFWWDFSVSAAQNLNAFAKKETPFVRLRPPGDQEDALITRGELSRIHDALFVAEQNPV